METAILTDNVLSTTSAKNISYVLGFIYASQYLGFNPDSIATLMFLMIVDVVTGVTRSALVNGAVSIKSSVGIKGLLTKILVLTGLFSFALALKSVGFEAQSMAQGIVMIFILAETYSILGNIVASINKSNKVEYDAVAFLMSRVKSLLGHLINDHQ